MYPSQMRTRTNRDPAAMCLLLLSLVANFAPDSPMAAQRARRVSESRTSPACCRPRGKHSGGMRNKKKRPTKAISASSS